MILQLFRSVRVAGNVTYDSSYFGVLLHDARRHRSCLEQSGEDSEAGCGILPDAEGLYYSPHKVCQTILRTRVFEGLV